MYCPTADSVATIRITRAPRQHRPEWDAKVIERYTQKRRAKFRDLLSNCRPETLIYQPSQVQPAWLQVTKQRIRESITSIDRADINDGRWLTQDIADAALDFFAKTADLLPNEPSMYSSRKGDLVAEFKAEKGHLTSIVTPTCVVLYAVVDGEPIEKRISEATELRKEVGKLTQMLRAGQHGSMATYK